MDRKLLHYLPPFLQQIREYKEITKIEQTELEKIYTSIEEILNNMFVETANDKGISRLETILNIASSAQDTLEERKFRLFLKLNEQLPFTFNKLEEQLTNLCGSDGYSLDLDYDHFHLTVLIQLKSKKNLEDVRALIERVVPANILCKLDLKYNQHEILSKFSYKDLEKFIHKELRSEVLE